MKTIRICTQRVMGKTCNGTYRPGTALRNTTTCGDEGTCCDNGPAQIIKNVLKCDKCGHSKTNKPNKIVKYKPVSEKMSLWLSTMGA